MSNTYSVKFKIMVVEDALNRAKGVSLESKATEHGIGLSTLSKWMRQYHEGKLGAKDSNKPKPETTLQALVLDDSGNSIKNLEFVNNIKVDNEENAKNISDVINYLKREKSIHENSVSNLELVSLALSTQSVMFRICIGILEEVNTE